MFPLFGKRSAAGFIVGAIFLLWNGLTFAGNDENSLEIITGYEYLHIGEDLPAGLKEQLDTNSRMFDLSLEFSTGNDNSQLSFGIDGKRNQNHYETEVKEFAWSGKQGKILYEAGKTKWLWGRGLGFNPTCPQDTDTYYWGGQLSYLNNSRGFTIGGASGRNSYPSDISDTIITGRASGDDYTGWLRFGQIFETSDWTAVTTYQSANGSWNYGMDYSQDLQNGFELHGGLNYNISDSTVHYLIGGEYSGKYFYTAEFYHANDEVMILAMSNAAGILGSWQWEFREIYNLTDCGEIRKINLKYIKNHHIVPELEISMNAGPKASYYRRNPVDYYVLLKVTTQF